MKDALEMAGTLRLRPILMTTIAMIAGMMPVAMALGELDTDDAAADCSASRAAISFGFFVRASGQPVGFRWSLDIMSMDHQKSSPSSQRVELLPSSWSAEAAQQPLDVLSPGMTLGHIFFLISVR